jgi:hypothetical protein
LPPQARAAAADTTTTPEPNPEAGRWEFLRRPLELPRYDPRDGCPISGSTVLSTGAKVTGKGPVYNLGGGEVTFRKDQPGSGNWAIWAGQKFAFISSPDLHGEALIRGRQLDGDHEVRFGDGPDPSPEFYLTLGGNAFSSDAPPGGSLWVTFVRFQAPGCYALQVDGIDFSYHIVLDVKQLD